MFDVLGAHHFRSIDDMKCRDRVFRWFDCFEASFGATIAEFVFPIQCPKCALLCALINIIPLRELKIDICAFALTHDLTSFYDLFVCVLRSCETFG